MNRRGITVRQTYKTKQKNEKYLDLGTKLFDTQNVNIEFKYDPFVPTKQQMWETAQDDAWFSSRDLIYKNRPSFVGQLP